MLITVFFMGVSLLSDLLVIHCIAGLVDRFGSTDLFHSCYSALLTNVQGHLSDVLNLSLDESLVVSRGCQKSCINVLYTLTRKAPLCVMKITHVKERRDIDRG